MLTSTYNIHATSAKPAATQAGVHRTRSAFWGDVCVFICTAEKEFTRLVSGCDGVDPSCVLLRDTK